MNLVLLRYHLPAPVNEQRIRHLHAVLTSFACFPHKSHTSTLTRVLHHSYANALHQTRHMPRRHDAAWPP